MTEAQNKSIKSYTMDVLDSMIQSMIVNKKAKGFNRREDGLFEDCLGQVFTVTLSQDKKLDAYKNEMHTIELKFVPVNLIGRI